jgi:hypothetical protein
MQQAKHEAQKRNFDDAEIIKVKLVESCSSSC